MPTQVGKDQQFSVLIAGPNEFALPSSAVFPITVRAPSARTADQEKLVDLLLFAARLFALIRRKLALPKIGKNFPLPPRLCIASLLLLARPLKLIPFRKQRCTTFPAGRIAERRDMKFRAGYPRGRLFQDLTPRSFDFAVDRIDLRAYLGDLRCNRLQPLQLDFLEALAQPQQRRKREMKWHQIQAESASKDLIACSIEVLSSFFCCRNALISGSAATA